MHYLDAPQAWRGGSVRGSEKTPKELLVEPDVFHTPTIDHAIDHRRQTFHLGLPAGRAPRMKTDRPRPPSCSVLQLSAPLPVGLARLSMERILEPAMQYPVKLRSDSQVSS